MSLGGKCIQRSESIVQHLESHSAGLLQANRTKSVSQGALIQKQTGDNRVKRGLVPKVCINIVTRCFTFIIHYFVYFIINPYLKRECEKGSNIYRGASHYKTSNFNLRFLSHFCMDFYATKMSRSS